MKKKLCFLMALALMLLVCGCNKTNEGNVVNVYNWGEYLDLSILDEFEDETGITVNYKTFESNEQMYSVLKNGGASYDVIIPSDYMISRMIEEDMLEKLDFSNIPNFDLVSDQYKNLSYDPTNEYSVPYMWGTLGLIYNSAYIDEEITSWSALWDEQYKGNYMLASLVLTAIGADGVLTALESKLLGDVLGLDQDGVQKLIKMYDSRMADLADHFVDNLGTDVKADALMLITAIAAVDEKISREETGLIKKLLA